MPYDEYLETRFYREWARPQGWVDSANALLDKSATGFALLSVYRHATSGLVDDDMRRRMHLIVPHVRRAVMIGKAIGLKAAEAAMFADAFDGLSAGVFFVDAAGYIIHANASGDDMAGTGRVLQGTRDLLLATDPQANQLLRDAILAAGSGGAVVPLTAAPDERWIAHVLPLTAHTRQRAGIPYAAVAAVFVRRASLDTPTPLDTIAKLYKLTPSESRVLGAVIDTGGVSTVAEALGVSEATVKTHLQHLFEKTGVRRQVDLMKLVASHVSPLRS